MKKFKKIVSLLVAMVMVLAMTTSVFAAQEGTLENGSIEITKAAVGERYDIYQILYIESYNATTGAYAYKANSAWEAWLETQTTYVSVDAQGYVTWVEGADVAAFAKAAINHATNNSISNVGSQTAESTTVKFENLKLGYYLVNTTQGTLCSLDTTNPSAKMEDKTIAPTIEKKVKEDSTGNYGDENTAQIGDTVEFKSTVHAKKSARNYVVHDTMTEGLTLNQDSIEIKVGGTTLTKGTDYTVAFNAADECDFEITFAQTYLDTITADTDIVITYSAVLNEKAAISTDANTNEIKLVYGNAGTTEWDTTKTYTFKFEVIKTDASNKLLDGAKFELYDAKTGGSKIALVKETGTDSVYHVATSVEQQTEGFESAVIEAKDGKAVIKGMDADTTYWLEETEAPAGYNKLAERVEVKIENANLTATLDTTGKTWVSGGVHIVNQTGTELPSTGGMGTTVLYVAGMILVLAAVVLLFARRRMSREA